MKHLERVLLVLAFSCCVDWTYSSACQQRFNSSEGEFSFPSNPDTSDNNGLDCSYTIHSPTGQPFILKFTSFNVDCLFDSIKVIEDPVTPGVKLCGNSLPRPIVSVSGSLNIQFHSDWFVDSDFHAEYNECRDCVKSIHKDEGFIEHLVNTEDSVTDTVYLVDNPNKRPIILEFTELKLDESEQCKFEYVQVKEGFAYNSKTVGTYCGYVTPELISVSSGKLAIIFHSEEPYNRDHGFKAKFKEASESTEITSFNPTVDNENATHADKSTAHQDTSLKIKTNKDTSIETKTNKDTSVEIKTASPKFNEINETTEKTSLGESRTTEDNLWNENNFPGVFNGTSSKTALETTNTTTDEQLIGQNFTPGHLPRTFKYHTITDLSGDNSKLTVIYVVGAVAFCVVTIIIVNGFIFWRRRRRRRGLAKRQASEYNCYGTLRTALGDPDGSPTAIDMNVIINDNYDPECLNKMHRKRKNSPCVITPIDNIDYNTPSVIPNIDESPQAGPSKGRKISRPRDDYAIEEGPFYVLNISNNDQAKKSIESGKSEQRSADIGLENDPNDTSSDERFAHATLRLTDI